ncbi:hypothetical protein SAMN05421553_5038 [Pseudomonas anguilliseptica]|uniref:Uncharacterized protein n=1 Tax=Pseudomonas anguilliseptica TaxID=53406 RepID=A0A1H5LGT1_PSEAG|nr:hypothetical protein SAMN05421553_5038 [Pseudomonas anguilliseptica]
MSGFFVNINNQVFKTFYCSRLARRASEVNR